MQNPLTTSKHYSNKNCIILPVHVSSISSSAFLLTQWMNEVPQHFIIQFILVFQVWQTLFSFSFMSCRKRTLSIRVSCPGLFHRGTVTKHVDSITVTHTRKSLGYPPSAILPIYLGVPSHVQPLSCWSMWLYAFSHGHLKVKLGTTWWT